MSEEFVGFAKSPKQREGVSIQRAEEVFTSNLNRSDAAARLFAKDQAQLWLGDCAKWEIGVGTKLDISSGILAGQRLIITEANLPKAITLVADSFGELRATFAKQFRGTKVSLRVTRWSLPEEEKEFEKISEHILFQAKRIFGGD